VSGAGGDVALEHPVVTGCGYVSLLNRRFEIAEGGFENFRIGELKGARLQFQKPSKLIEEIMPLFFRVRADSEYDFVHGSLLTDAATRVPHIYKTQRGTAGFV